MGERIIIIGRCTPISRPDSSHLMPDETLDNVGFQLWKLLEARTGATKTDYLRTFQRYCLMRGHWKMQMGRQEWKRIESDILSNYDLVVLLGRGVITALGLHWDLPVIGIRGGLVAMPEPLKYTPILEDTLAMRSCEILMEELYLRATA